MPAETHQLGRDVDPAIVAEYLDSLLNDGSQICEARAVTSAGFGVQEADVEWLWEPVCEEFAERTIAPELEPGFITPAMTMQEAAGRIANLLREGDSDAPS